MCNKQHHETLFGAQRQAVSLSKKKGVSLEKIRIYECECCCFHVTRWSVGRYNKSKQR